MLIHKSRSLSLLVVCMANAVALGASAYAQSRPSIAGLQADIATLQAQIASSTIPDIAGYAAMDLSDPGRPTLRITGANLQVVNGLGVTESVNGVGNVIVGYDEVRTVESLRGPACSIGRIIAPQESCEFDGGIWAVSHKSGSHNVVAGARNSYSQYGGMVSGEGNDILGPFTNVVGGNDNRAGDAWSTVSGGQLNTTQGDYASATAGYFNRARGAFSSVTGGRENEADGPWSTVSGGGIRTAPGATDWVAGGLFQSF